MSFSHQGKVDMEVMGGGMCCMSWAKFLLSITYLCIKLTSELLNKFMPQGRDMQSYRHLNSIKDLSRSIFYHFGLQYCAKGFNLYTQRTMTFYSCNLLKLFSPSY
jgi:hypothetical protein